MNYPTCNSARFEISKIKKEINDPCLKSANHIQNRISHWLQLTNNIATELNENDNTGITLGTVAGTRGLGENGQEGFLTAHFFRG